MKVVCLALCLTLWMVTVLSAPSVDIKKKELKLVKALLEKLEEKKTVQYGRSMDGFAHGRLSSLKSLDKQQGKNKIKRKMQKKKIKIESKQDLLQRLLQKPDSVRKDEERQYYYYESWTTAAPAEPVDCGPGHFTGPEGVFTSPGGGSRYPDNANCEWHIDVAEGKRAHIHFADSFGFEFGDTACSFDFVKIYDGASTSKPVIGVYCGSNAPGDLTASGSHMTVVFVSDVSVNDIGFTAHWSAKDPPTTDGGTGGGTGTPASRSCGVPVHSPSFTRIVGGIEAKPNSWPWQISLQINDDPSCGGSIAHQKWVITAAHCVHGNEDTPSIFKVVAGEHDLNTQSGLEKVINVKRVIKHEHYDKDTTDNDVALLELEHPLTFSDEILPVCLPTADVTTGMDCVATGWGRTENTGANNVLRQVILPVVDHNQCNTWYKAAGHKTDITANMLCAGYPEGQKDSCQGDSGGPFVCLAADNKYHLYGVVSWGYGCAEREKPGVYAKVSRYNDWLATNSNQDIVA